MWISDNQTKDTDGSPGFWVLTGAGGSLEGLPRMAVCLQLDFVIDFLLHSSYATASQDNCEHPQRVRNEDKKSQLSLHLLSDED